MAKKPVFLSERIKQIGRDAALAYVKGKGPWKDTEINLPDDDYAVQCFIACALEASKETFSIVTRRPQPSSERKAG